jgi:hypothetical protein
MTACKREFAAVIDRMNNLRNASADLNAKRLASTALSAAQAAYMRAMQAITGKG